MHAGRYRQKAGGTHSTGMHTCLLNYFRIGGTILHFVFQRFKLDKTVIIIITQYLLTHLQCILQNVKSLDERNVA